MATQDFSIGSTVKVGFMSLVVRAKIGAEHIATNKAGDKLYCITPYSGCRQITSDEARELMQAAADRAARAAAQAIAKAQAVHAVDALFA